MLPYLRVIALAALGPINSSLAAAVKSVAMSTRAKATTARRSRTQPRAGTTYAMVVSEARRYPGVEESTSYNTPALKVKGKLISRPRTEAEGALALYCDFIDREMLLQAAPETFFITDHYANYPMILVRLERLLPEALPNLIERAWRMRAPKKLVEEYDKRHES